VFGGVAPGTETIEAWFDKFLATENVQNQSAGTRRRVYEEEVSEILTASQRSPSKSVRQASMELYVPRATVYRVLHGLLHLFAYSVQISQELKPDDKPKRIDFAVDMLHRIDMDPGFLRSILFSKKATFHLSENVSRYNTHVRVSEKPHIHREVV
jgi:hypothetical protein